MGKRFVGWIALILVGLYFFSGFYAVSQDELGIHIRFGKIVNPVVPPGIHYRIPWPVDEIRLVRVHQVQRTHITDFRNDMAMIEEGGAPPLSLRKIPQPCAITGDNNLVNLDCIIQYKISDPEKYLFFHSRAERLLKDMACNRIIHCLAGMPVDTILTAGKRAIASEVKAGLQAMLEEADTGLAVVFLELKEVKAPPRVQSYFYDVINAKNDKEKAIDFAESYRNVSIPSAQARASKLIHEAEGYKNKVVTEARGDAQRFLDRLSEYSKSRSITHHRLLMETGKEIMTTINKLYLVDSTEEPPPKLKLFKK